MDKLVKRVTIIHGSGEHRRAEMVYEHDDDSDDERVSTSWTTDTPRTAIGVGQQAANAGLEAAKGASKFGTSKVGSSTSWTTDTPRSAIEVGQEAAKAGLEAAKGAST